MRQSAFTGRSRFWRALRTLGVAYVVAEFFLTPGLGLVQTHAQSGAACPIGAPRTITSTAYTLRNDDECSALVFTATSPITVTAPSATTVAPGFQAMLIPINNGLTVTSAGSGSLIGTGTAQLIGAGQSGVLLGDGTNYFWAAGAPFMMAAAAVSGYAQAGTNWSNSPTFMLPNGVLQITNPASVVPDNNSGAFEVCRGGAKRGALGPTAIGPPNPPSWWQVLDPFGRALRIPLC